jgi:hypothetical protein
MHRMPIERARQEIEDGIASAKAALGDNADALAPFFRIPGLLRADAVEDYAAEQGIQIWSADFLADDWRHVSSARVYDLAISRLEAKGKGILLLHDIQARTVAALPRILETLKARGYRIVHVVPATPERPATPTEPQEWLLHPAPDAIAHWPEVPNLVIANRGSLPAPARSDFDATQESPMLHEAALSRPSWPEPPELAAGNAAVTLAAPAPSVFEIEGGLDAARHGAALSRRLHKTVSVAPGALEPVRTKRMSRREARRLAFASSRQLRLAQGSGRQSHRDAMPSRKKGQAVTTVHRGPVKRLVQVRKRRA